MTHTAKATQEFLEPHQPLRNKQAAEGSCSKGRAEHLKRGNTAFGDVHFMHSQTAKHFIDILAVIQLSAVKFWPLQQHRSGVCSFSVEKPKQMSSNHFNFSSESALAKRNREHLHHQEHLLISNVVRCRVEQQNGKSDLRGSDLLTPVFHCGNQSSNCF